jgi:hypothetical protein
MVLFGLLRATILTPNTKRQFELFIRINYNHLKRTYFGVIFSDEGGIYFLKKGYTHILIDETRWISN